MSSSDEEQHEDKLRKRYLQDSSREASRTSLWRSRKKVAKLDEPSSSKRTESPASKSEASESDSITKSIDECPQSIASGNGSSEEELSTSAGEEAREYEEEEWEAQTEPQEAEGSDFLTDSDGSPPASPDSSPTDSDESEPAQPNVSSSEFITQKYKLDKLLIPDCIISKFEILLMVLHFVIRFSLSSVALKALLLLINVVVGVSVLPPSEYIFEQKLFSSEWAVEPHFYCPRCSFYLGKLEKGKEHSCPECQTKVSTDTAGGATNFFLTIPIKAQIKEILERKGHKIINYRDTRFKDPDFICDVFDGISYADLERDKCLTKHDITVTFSTDGVALFRSSKSSLYPIQLRINEMPPSERFSVENLILGALWFGRGTIDMSTYLTPFIKEMQELEETGIQWFDSESQTMITTRVFLLQSCFDTVAKPKVLNMKQFNGHDSCYLCEHPGESLGPNQVRFPSAVSHPERTSIALRQSMAEAMEGGEIIDGMKGGSALIGLSYFDLTYGVVIDYMHSHLLGLTKYMWTNIWTDKSNHNEGYYLNDDAISKIDKRISKLQPPSDISRDPRTMAVHSANLKANEWRTWLFFYGPLVLNGILPLPYYRNFCMLSTALYALNSKKIPRCDLRAIKDLLSLFLSQFETLYSKKYMTYNAHLTSHLWKSVVMGGPLWAFSAFPFEGNHMFLGMFVRGGRGVPQQIAKRYTMFCNIPKVVTSHPLLKECVTDYCQKIMTFTRLKKAYKANNITVLRNVRPKQYLPSEHELGAFTGLNLDLENLCEIKSIIFQGQRFCPFFEAGQKKRTRDNSVICLDMECNFARIFKIFSPYEAPDDVYLLIKNFNIESRLNPNFNFKSQIFLCQPYAYDAPRIVKANDIIEKCVLLSVEDCKYIVRFPNKCEKD